MTPAQLAALKADILADQVLAAFPNNSDGNSAIAAAYNTIVASAYWVWKTSMPTSDAFDQIVWANLTPQDLPPKTTAEASAYQAGASLSEALLLWKARSLACQGKQFNVQTMLSGRATIDPSKANVRAGLQDALTGVPSGASGANKQAGWAALQVAMSRQATRVEKLFATGSGTVPSPSTMVFEGQLTYQDVEAARNS